MAAHNRTNTAPKRARLIQQREPYWHRISKGRFIGFRKTASGGTWIARSGKTQQRFASEAELDYDAALKVAVDWCDRHEYSASPHYSLLKCVDDYIAHLATRKGPATARANRLRLEHHLPKDLLRTKVNRLTTRQLKAWHEGMVKQGDAETVRKSKDSANRTLNALKAALNLAHLNGLTGSDAAWKRVRRFPDTARARDLFLTDQQVTALLAYTDGAFHDFCRAAILTGARADELADAAMADFDPQAATLFLNGKTGPRQTWLSDAAVAFFRKQANGKLPRAILLPNPLGGKWYREGWRDEMKAARQKARLPGEAVFYSLRHYAISKMLLAGVNAQVVAENCGTSVSMIEKHYGKFQPADRRAMLNRVEVAGGQ